jgi:hypothetical protein
MPMLQKQHVRWTSFSDFLKIDRLEQERGAARGKIREKIIDVAEMMRVIDAK